MVNCSPRATHTGAARPPSVMRTRSRNQMRSNLDLCPQCVRVEGSERIAERRALETPDRTHVPWCSLRPEGPEPGVKRRQDRRIGPHGRCPSIGQPRRGTASRPAAKQVASCGLSGAAARSTTTPIQIRSADRTSEPFSAASEGGATAYMRSIRAPARWVSNVGPGTLVIQESTPFSIEPQVGRSMGSRPTVHSKTSEPLMVSATRARSSIIGNSPTQLCDHIWRSASAEGPIHIRQLGRGSLETRARQFPRLWSRMKAESL